EVLESLILNYKQITDAKYGAILTTLTAKATHPNRYQETTVGNLFCDIMKEHYGLDLVLIGSGSLRKELLGPVVTKGGLLDMYSYDEKMISMKLTGKEIKNAMLHMFREAAADADGGHSEYYQISEGFHFTYDKEKNELIEATLYGQEIEDDALFRTGIEGFHTDNMEKFLALDPDLVQSRGEWKIITNNIRTSVEEYMKVHTHLCPALFGRTRKV
ncbi:MAG: 5'-nucleotidase C-terminal domain-containing protein, partial [Clostridiales bacterium]|nr:5'-nucleotidase C-terminal domain-containing protein [Candidatus Blautia equi]